MTETNRRRFLALTPVAAMALAAPATLRAQTVMGQPGAQPTQNIADIMAGDTRFQRFLNMVTLATAVQDLRAQGPITVFAPVEAAFVNAPAGLLQELQTRGNSGDSSSSGDASERNRWIALITYHIVPGAFSLAQLGGAERRLRTRNGSDIRVVGSGNDFRVSNPAPAQQIAGFGAFGAQAAPPARVVGSELAATNGLIVPIDQILWP